MHEGQRSGEGGRWRKRRRNGGGDDGRGGGDDGGSDYDVGEAGQKRMGEPGHDWQAGGESRGGAPAGVPSLGEGEGKRTWRKRSDGGRSGGGSDGATGRSGSVSQHLSVVTTGRRSYSRLLLECRVSQRKPQGLLNPPPPCCRTHHHLPVSCHMTGSRYGTGGEAEVSDWLSS